jgi:CheY-like chemotaxis protein
MGKKILLADDSITIQKVIELTFSDEDFEVVTVGNGRLAMERVTDVRPDVVLCDIIMPEKDGYEVCDFIKKNPLLSHIPVLLLTGAFEPFDQDRAARVGCDGFLAKPFEPQTLIAKVKDLLSKAGSKTSAAGSMRATPSSAAAASPPPVAAAPPPPPPAAAPAPFREPEPEEIEEEPEFSTMVSRPGAHSQPFEDRLYSAPAVVPPPELTPVTAEEAASLGADRNEPEGSSTVMFQPGRAPWSQQTIEVPLEMRAKAGVAAQAEPEPLFEEVFDAEPAPPPVPAAPPPIPTSAAAASAASDEAEEVFVEPADDEPQTWPAPRPTATAAAGSWGAPPPPPAPPSSSTSFADVKPASAEPAAPASQAAEVAVPPDMVEKIAQRVVAQISERVVREVAWEVIPDLAEALIKKEIERLKAELQQS